MSENYKNLDIYKYFKESKLHSAKANTFFNIYNNTY